jgi:hypothetical protein
MTSEQLRNLAKLILAIGFQAGVEWMASDKPTGTVRSTLDETLEQNIEFINSVANMELAQ